MCRVEVAKALRYTRADALREFTIDTTTRRVSGGVGPAEQHSVAETPEEQSRWVVRVQECACVDKFCNLSFHDLESFFFFAVV
jgi:hypothetical protein